MVLQTYLNGGIQTVSPVLLSQFDINDTERAFIAGKEGLSWSDFQIGYDGYHCCQNDFIIDAEKCISIAKDDNMCWAAAAANMLYYANWWPVETEDAVFSVFVDSFQNGEKRGGNILYGIDWFLTGNYTPSRLKLYDQPLEGTGGGYKDVFSEIELSDFLFNKSITVNNFIETGKMLESGYAVGVSFGFITESGARVFGHALSMWGFTYDTSLSVTDPNSFTGIIVSDSDDDHWSCYNGCDAPDTLKIIPVFYDSESEKYILDPGYSEYYTCVLEKFTLLAPNPGYVPDGNSADVAVKIYSNGELILQTNSAADHVLRGAENDLMHISSGGTACNISVESGTSLCVSSGGIANWGNDTVEQFVDGSITLWFEYGSEENWNAESLTYRDGENCVKVIGSADIELKFGSNADLPVGIFADEVTGNIFESRINSAAE